MTDGAHLGVGAERALGTILGGEPQPAEADQETVIQMRDRLLAAPRCDDPAAMASYDACATSVAGEILRWALANPERYANTPAENELDYGPGGEAEFWKNFDGGDPPPIKRLGLYETLKAEGIPLDTLGITGFQWGWAYNAARRCLELPPVPNPAIVSI